jgi:hypothetical protein
MNSSITFTDLNVFNSAVTLLDFEMTPEYDIDEANLSIYSEDIDAIIDLLHDGEIYSFSCYRRDDYEGDQFLSDAEADADALASAGMGTDEDYGYYGGEDE